MRRLITILIFWLALSIQTIAQESSEISAILALTGTTDIEELDQYEVERLSALIARPLKINMVTTARIISTGLFSAYQAASIADYSKRHGDIMSFGELSLLDGFNEGYVKLLMPFIDLSSGELLSQSSGAYNELSVRCGISFGEKEQWNYALKYNVGSSTGVAGGFAISRSSSASKWFPEAATANLEYELRMIPLRIIAGDYNARFGQGLVMWNGMSMSSLAVPSLFMRRPSSFSRSSSFTGSQAMTGIASSLYIKNLVINASVAFPGIKSVHIAPERLTVLPLINVTWNLRKGQVGATHYLDFLKTVKDMKTSIDMAFCIGGTDIFAEVAYDWIGCVTAGLIGTSFPLGELFRGAAMLRAFPSAYNPDRSGAQRSTTTCSNEYSLSSAFEYLSADRKHTAALSADMAYFPEPKSKASSEDFQVKVLAEWQWTGEKIALKMRLSERVRSWGAAARTDFRTDISLPLDKLVMNMRMELLHCKALAGLVYGEVGYVAEHLSSYLRAGVFCADNWDDRIYVYERDAPGGFNVPAMYGRGVWAAANVSWKPCRWMKIYSRASFTGYPFMSAEKKKPGKAELKLQCMFSF